MFGGGESADTVDAFWKSVSCDFTAFTLDVSLCYLLLNNFDRFIYYEYIPQEQLECTKRGWEMQQQQKLKEEEEHLTAQGEEDLFTYTREDAYNMVSNHCDLLIKQELMCSF